MKKSNTTTIRKRGRRRGAAHGSASPTLEQVVTAAHKAGAKVTCSLTPKEKEPHHWAKCFLEHAARETCWMREHAKQCEYQAAHDAGVRRGVWLNAALLAQEGKR